MPVGLVSGSKNGGQLYGADMKRRFARSTFNLDIRKR